MKMKNIKKQFASTNNVRGQSIHGMATHLRNTHKVSKKLARTISKIICEGTIRKGCDKGIPEDGTLPQEGLPVFDGFRCGACSQFKARSVPEVDGH